MNKPINKKTITQGILISTLFSLLCLGVYIVLQSPIERKANPEISENPTMTEKPLVMEEKVQKQEDHQKKDIDQNLKQEAHPNQFNPALQPDPEALKRLAYEKMMREHPYSNRDYEKMEGLPKFDRPDLAMEQDFLRTLDPALGTVPYERLEIALQQAKLSQQKQARAGIASVNWQERGPNNIGGRTRTLMFDPNDVNNKKLWAGAISGGLWVNNDITSATSTWTKISDQWSNLAISSMAFDPSNKQTFYLGTGEGWFNGDALRGGGVYKSTDGGATWNVLTSTIPGAGTEISDSFYYVQKIVVNSTGQVFAATRGLSGTSGNGGILKSTDGGASWTRVLAPASGKGVATDASMLDRGADIEIASNGDLYATIGIASKGKIYRSTDGGTSWTDITPVAASDPERIEIAIAPSASSSTVSTVIYAVASDGSSSNNDVLWLQKSTNGGVNWVSQSIPLYREQSCTIGTKHFTRAQAWYDLIMMVHPTDPNVIIAGGIDIHRATDGGGNWLNVSYWTGTETSPSCKPYVHADQHGMVFRPGTGNEMVFGTDGGVFYSADVGDKANANPNFSSRNNGYNVTQFYSCAMKNGLGENYFLGGAQDNGTLQLNSNSITSGTSVNGGDGAFCFIDQNEPNIQIVSYVNNTYTLLNASGVGVSTLINDSNTGSFINPADYDDANNILYTYKGSSSLYKVTGVGATNTLSTMTATGIGTVTHIRVAKSANTVFVGNSSGKVLKLTNTSASTATVTDITGSIGVTGSVSCIEIGASDNELLVTYSNFGVNSVWYTNNGGTTWTNKDNDGSLPDMPIRWALFNPNNRLQVILATNVGVWSTTDITATNPGWQSTNNAVFPNVRTDMLKVRSIDNLVLVATHGRGLFSSNLFAPQPAPVITSFSPTKGVKGDQVVISGSNFSTTPSGNIVKFIDQAATVSAATSTSLTVTVPMNAVTGKISVATTGGVAVSSTDFIVTPVTSLNNLQNTPGFIVYPNPTQDKVYLDIANAGNAYVWIYNEKGEIVSEQKLLIQNDENPEINVSGFQKGLYFIKLSIAGEEKIQRFIKE